jgi:hypothetical protein
MRKEMRKSIIAAFGGVLASGLLMSAPLAHADPCSSQGLITAISVSDARPSLTCVQPGHVPPGYVDATGGNPWGGFNPQSSYKMDPDPYGHNGPCNSRDVHVSKIDPQTGNAIEVWGPPGCDPMLPMTGDN